MSKVLVKGIRIWVTGEQKAWDQRVSNTLAQRIVGLIENAFKELIDDGIIDVSTDDLDPTEVDE